MNKLPASTVKLITCSQVIRSPQNIVKELVENSLDAGADCIDVKLEQSGLLKIEVSDNGPGIANDYIKFLCQPHYTSKLTSFEDLYALQTYGFRGEALYSICTIASIGVTTKTVGDEVAMVYQFDVNGNIVESKPTHQGNGTTITVTKLFRDLPVRRQAFKTLKSQKDELKKIEDLLISFGMIYHNVRLTLRNDKKEIWRKNRTSNLGFSIRELFKSNIMQELEEFIMNEDSFQLHGYVPKKDYNMQIVGRSLPDRIFLSVNRRPVVISQIKKVLKESFSLCSTTSSSQKYPFAVLAITVKPDMIDINLEPDKSKVLLQNMDDIVKKLKEKMMEMYGWKINENVDNSIDPVPQLPSFENVFRTEAEVEAELVRNEPMSIQEQSNDGLTSLANQKSESCEKNNILECENEIVINSNNENVDKQFCKTNGLLMEGLQSGIRESDNSGENFQIADGISSNIISAANPSENCVPANTKSIRHFPPAIEKDKASFAFEKESPLVENDERSPQAVSGDQWRKGLLNMSPPVMLLTTPPPHVHEKLVKERKSSSSEKKRKRKLSSANDESFTKLEKFFKSPERGRRRGKGLPVTKITFCVERVKSSLKENQEDSNRSDSIKIIGKLDSLSIWIVKNKKELVAVDGSRLNEILIYNKLLIKHQLEPKSLVKPIKLNTELIGNSNYNKLCTMLTEPSLVLPGRFISNANIRSNGFLIKRTSKIPLGHSLSPESHLKLHSTTASHNDQDKDSFTCTHVPDQCQSNGIEDLVDILEHLDESQNNPENEKLYRPPKIQEWIKVKSETLSQNKQQCSKAEFKEMFDWLVEQKDFPNTLCSHGNQVLMILGKYF